MTSSGRSCKLLHFYCIISGHVSHTRTHTHTPVFNGRVPCERITAAHVYGSFILAGRATVHLHVTRFLGPNPTCVNTPDGISIGSAVFAGLTIVADRPTWLHRCTVFIMAALCSRCGHYIFVLFLILRFFPRLISAV